MRTIPHAEQRRTFHAHERRAMVATSPVMGRPKIDGLVSFSLRLMGDQKAALESPCDVERTRRGDPGLTVTDLMREAFAEYLAKHAKRRRSAP